MQRQVLKCYKAILRARETTFAGDEAVLRASLEDIRSQFKSNINEKDGTKVEELLKQGWDAEKYIRTCIAQGVLNDRGNFELRLPEGLPDNATLEPITGSKCGR
jgi:hypothetical protein